MNFTTRLGKTSQPRDNKGKFSTSKYGAKSLRSMKLSDEGWQLLEDKANAQGTTRTEVIEQLARGSDESAIILKAIEAFIKLQEEEYGENPAQKNKTFSTSTRAWDKFNQFYKLIKDSPWELGIDEELPPIDDGSDD